MQKKLLALVLAAAMLLSMAACGSTPSTPEKTPDTPQASTEEKKPDTAAEAPKEKKDTFTIAISYMPDTLAPHAGGSDDYTSMTRPLYDKLFVQNITGGLDYYLADSLEISEDGKVYKIHIRDDANWSDGTPITTKDIQFCMDYTVHKYGYNRFIRVNDKEGSVNIIDDKTIEFILPEPYNYQIAMFAGMNVYPTHVFNGDPVALENATEYYSTPGFVTSGAYVVSEVNEDSFVCTARDDYYRGTPSIKKVVMKVIGSGSTRSIAFESGEIDYMRITTVDELEKYSAQPDKYNIYSMPEARLNYLAVNPYGPAQLTDAQREALFYAINGDEVIAGAYGSEQLATNPNSLLTPEMSLYNPETPDYVYDLEKAKELAKSSGLEGMTLVYIYNKDRANMEAVAVVLQQQLAQIGVNLQIEGMDSPSFFPRFFAASSYNFNGQEKTWDLGTNGWDSLRGTTLDKVYSTINHEGNAWGYTPSCHDLAVKVNTTRDPEEAQKLTDELMEIVLNQHRTYPLTYTNYVMVSQKYVSGLDCSPIVPEFIDYLGISVNG